MRSHHASAALSLRCTLGCAVCCWLWSPPGTPHPPRTRKSGRRRANRLLSHTAAAQRCGGFADLAKRLYLRVRLRPVDEGALQPAIARRPAQPGVNALAHFHRWLSRSMSLGTSLSMRRCTSGLAGGVLCSGFQQGHRKHLGDVVTTGCSNTRQFSPSSGLKVVPNKTRPDVVVQPARQLRRVDLQIRLGRCVAILLPLGMGSLSAWLMRRVRRDRYSL